MENAWVKLRNIDDTMRRHYIPLKGAPDGGSKRWGNVQRR